MAFCGCCGCWGCCGAGLRGVSVDAAGAGAGDVVDINVERGNSDVGLGGGVGAFEFDGLFGAGQGIDGSAKDVGLGVAADVAGGLLDFHKLRLSLKTIEEKDAGGFREAKSRGDLWELGFRTFAILFKFLVEFSGFGNGSSGGALFLILLGGRPVDERGGEFFPVFAFSAEVADAVAFHFILGDELVGTVFQDKAAGEILGGRGKGECEPERGSEQEDRPEVSSGNAVQSEEHAI